jgi:NTE family protein
MSFKTASSQNNHSLGLALSGGGAKGAYQLGCRKAFIEKGLEFGGIAGSSIGALNGALICQGDLEAAKELWLELTRPGLMRLDYAKLGKYAALVAADVGLLFLPIPKVRLLKLLRYVGIAVKMGTSVGLIGALRKSGIFTLQSLRPTLTKYIDMKALLRNSVPLYVTVCGAPEFTTPFGPTHWFKIQDLDEEAAWGLISASMAIPYIFEPVEVDGTIYTDGGIGHFLPIQPLYENGFRRIIAVSTRSGLRLPQDEFPNCRIRLIQPKKPLSRFPGTTFRFTQKAVLEWMEEGYSDAMAVLRGVDA